MKSGVLHSIAAQGAGASYRALVSFLLMVFLGRKLGTAEFGGYVATLNAAILGLILIEAGWPTLVYRESASPDADTAATSRSTGHAGATMLGATLLLVTAALAVHALPLATALLCMGLVATCNLVSARMRGADRFGLESGWQIGGRTLSALAIVACVLWLDRSPPTIFLAWAAGLAFALLLFGWRWLAWPRWHGLAAGLVAALPFLLYEGLMAFLTKGDMAVLGMARLTEPDLSWYAACSRLTEAALLFFAPVTNVLLRHLRQASGDPPHFHRLLRNAVGGALALGLAALLASVAFGRVLMPWLFGEDYSGAGTLLPWIAAMLPFALANLVLFQAMLARKSERRLVLLMCFAAPTLLAALLLGAHGDGARGAAIGVLIVQAMLFVACITAGGSENAHRG